MYQFKYQNTSMYDFYPPMELIVTCIVPAGWLSLDLPTIGGRVNYYSSREQPAVCGYALFEFNEIVSSDKTLRKFSLDILRDEDKCFEKPIVIQVPNSKQIEVVLLNHLLGFLAISAWVAVDIADLIPLFQKSSTYYFKYGVGASPSDILPDIVRPETYRDVRCQYWMVFGDDQNLRLEHLGEAMDAMLSIHATEDSLVIACMAGVEQDKMLISMLVGCQE